MTELVFILDRKGRHHSDAVLCDNLRCEKSG